MRALVLILFIICFGLTSCEELIDIDLNAAAPRYVIEGDLTDLTTDQIITVSQTVAFDEDRRSNPVEDASVVVTDDRGRSYVFTHIGQGRYQASFRPREKRTYNLVVNIRGEEFKASSYVNPYIEVDSLGVIEDIIFNDTIYSVTLKFLDPKGESNFYKYNIAVNNSAFNFSRVYSDKFNDGLYVTHQISDADNAIKLGDSVTVRRQIIEKPVYTYWNEVQSANPGSAAPANPTSNISNGALGYFSVSLAKRYGFRINFQEL